MRVSVCAAAVSVAGLLMVDAARAQPAQYWYYCDATHTYYPYVSTCSAPWREVVPNTKVNGRPGYEPKDLPDFKTIADFRRDNRNAFRPNESRLTPITIKPVG